mgnify:CR=1 FL=1
MCVAFFLLMIVQDNKMMIYKYALVLLIIWALALGYSRIYVGVHYPLDVLSGFIFGACSGLIFYKLNNYLHSRFKLKV